jgi:hypothetical protein
MHIFVHLSFLCLLTVGLFVRPRTSDLGVGHATDYWNGSCSVRRGQVVLCSLSAMCTMHAICSGVLRSTILRTVLLLPCLVKRVVHLLSTPAMTWLLLPTLLVTCMNTKR